MMLTALLPYGSLHCLWHRLHQIVPRLDCPCGQSATNHSDLPHPISSLERPHSPASSTDTSAATSLDLLADLALKSTTSSGGSPEDDAPNMDVEIMDVSDGRRELNQKAGASGVLYLKDGNSANLKAFQVSRRPQTILYFKRIKMQIELFVYSGSATQLEITSSYLVILMRYT